MGESNAWATIKTVGSIRCGLERKKPHAKPYNQTSNSAERRSRKGKMGVGGTKG